MPRVAMDQCMYTFGKKGSQVGRLSPRSPYDDAPSCRDTSHEARTTALRQAGSTPSKSGLSDSNDCKRTRYFHYSQLMLARLPCMCRRPCPAREDAVVDTSA
ncbi:hypothetical protein PAXRUDRAFT_566884 [Paxillus rubicundulus Ve08.2h10]|uniref:Uncharacterized protein n=1 Tax=Paxillus rubicundulus Ve08.2h10 TaxID=930991 RepID=A0A0D0CEX5_9AGAM|nr:hypothetical protein PAXRUDRAFT_566884 [Paxillus rubicundulus Ve08.2h10]